jgi:hypothetical protein
VGSDERIEAYRLLVPSESYPLWQRRAIRSVPRRRDLYTSVADGNESDRVERWLNESVETPALAVLAKLRAGDRRLDAEERRRLARYLVALDMRNPASYSEFTTKTVAHFKGVMSTIMGDAIAKLEEARQRGEALPAPPPEAADTAAFLRTRVVATPGGTESHAGFVEATITVGREMWMHSIRRAVDTQSHHAEALDWQVLRPHPGWRWFTTDRPLLRLAYASESSYSFDGGWGIPNVELILPLSPATLLYARIGSASEFSGPLSLERTVTMQRLIAERAHRWVFSDARPKRVEWFRPRYVDRTAFTAEEAQWENFHTDQSASVHDDPFSPLPPGAHVVSDNERGGATS